jgi:hypothetical protein
MKLTTDFLGKALVTVIIVSITVMLSLCVMAGCDAASQQKTNNPSPEKARESVQLNDSTLLTEIGRINSKWESITVKLYVVKYDGCEYLVAASCAGASNGGVSTTVTHSASCPNPIHLAK